MSSSEPPLVLLHVYSTHAALLLYTPIYLEELQYALNHCYWKKSCRLIPLALFMADKKIPSFQEKRVTYPSNITA